MTKAPLIIVAGATASGKTALAISLAKEYDGEIISADSMQIYRGMDIGTAKPDLEEQCGIRHHLMDFAEPEENFSVADFVALAHKAADDILSRNKRVIVAGGTGLYIDSFAKDIDFDEEEQDEKIRAELSELAEKEGAEALFERLKLTDPLAASKLHPNNKKRVIRAIEFYMQHGESIIIHQERTKQKDSRYRALYMMIDYPREELYSRINRRVDIMLEKGLVSEAKALWDKRDKLGKTASQAIGYKELFDYFYGRCTIEEAAEEIKQRTRRYAKRQLTWFRANPQMHKLSPDNAFMQAKELCDDFLNIK